MVKHWFAILSLCLLASVGFSSAGAQQSSVRVLAVVNDDIITDVDLAYRINLAIMVAEVPNTTERRLALAPQVLDKLVADKIRLQEVKRLQIDIREKFVLDAFDILRHKTSLIAKGLKR